VTRAEYEKPEGACSYGSCLKKAIEGGRCGRHHRFAFKSRVRFGGENYEKVQRVRFGTDVGDPREALVEALAGDDALAVVDALDVYLDIPVGLQLSVRNPDAERDQAIRERDEAVARAERAEQGLNGSQVSEPVSPVQPEPPSSASSLPPTSPDVYTQNDIANGVPESTDEIVGVADNLRVAAASLRVAVRTLADVAASKLVAAVAKFKRAQRT